MDKLIESFEEFIDGASEVELRFETGTTGVTRVVARAFSLDGKSIGIRRWGFAKRSAAEDAIARMHKTLDERGYRMICTAYSIDEFNHRWAHEYYSYQD